MNEDREINVPTASDIGGPERETFVLRQLKHRQCLGLDKDQI